jgi:hypothetical protein
MRDNQEEMVVVVVVMVVGLAGLQINHQLRKVFPEQQYMEDIPEDLVDLLMMEKVVVVPVPVEMVEIL